jgi:hypothetical protein
LGILDDYRLAILGNPTDHSLAELHLYRRSGIAILVSEQIIFN